jgi:predicted nucleotidyltransferase
MDQKIIDELAKVLKQDAKTHAMWIKGSVAEGFADELSDVDLMIGIDEGCDDEVYSAIESFLRAQDDLAVNFDARQSFSKHSHKVYRLAQSNPYHFIEVTLLPHSGQVVFTEGVDKVKTLFDKDGSIKFKPLDNQKLQSELLERSRYLKEKIKIGELFVKKEITRRQYMDAMHNYQFWLV